jgi:hypothetical protein
MSKKVADNIKKNQSIDLIAIRSDRKRTNLLKKYEQKLISFLVAHIPSWVSPDMLTSTALFGGFIILVGFILATNINKLFLLISIAGFIIDWFGDSLDGNLAYFRNKPRKWYGFSLDYVIDWLIIIFIGAGYMVYLEGIWKWLGFCFVAFYGWAIIISLVRYKVTNQYIIDSGIFGPTEVRGGLILFLLLEILCKGTLAYSTAIICSIFLIVNILDFIKLLKEADQKDIQEKLTINH